MSVSNVAGQAMEFEDFSFYPINHSQIANLFEKQVQVFWTAEAVDFTNDRQQWDSLDDEEREFIKFWLAFFSQADGIVCENLVKHFQSDTSHIKEVGWFYAAQNLMEVIHNKVYGQMIEVFIRDNEEKMQIRNAIHHYPSIQKIANWIMKWMDSSIPLPERVIAFACVEGIFFTGAFCAIYWLKRKNVLPGLSQANEWIARDEALHTKFAVTLYYTLTIVTKEYEEVGNQRIQEIIDSAMSVAEDFIRNALKVELVGMNADEMTEYVQCTADCLSTSFGAEKIYNKTNPFPWMLLISLPNKSNFFEKRVSEYGRMADNKYDYTLDGNF